jgi:lipoprotein-anchoring transpeptidase ErfK/SrfK
MTAMTRRTVPARRWFLALVTVGLMAVPSAWAQTDPGTVAAPTKVLSWSARVLAPTAARTQPNRASKAVGVVQTTAPIGGGPMVLLVLERRVVGGREWVRLLLPRRPNGTSGWVLSDVLRFRRNPMRIVIDQSDRITSVYRSGVLVLRVRNAVGKPATPTPFGHFAIAEKILTPPNGFLGPVVMPTTGFSETLNEYEGGNGRFALHGTSLPDLIGTRASHGCIRHRNRDILRISRLVSVGTPVNIQP